MQVVPPGMCLFCLMGLPHPLDLPDPVWPESSEPQPVDAEE